MFFPYSRMVKGRLFFLLGHSLVFSSWFPPSSSSVSLPLLRCPYWRHWASGWNFEFVLIAVANLVKNGMTSCFCFFKQLFVGCKDETRWGNVCNCLIVRVRLCFCYVCFKSYRLTSSAFDPWQAVRNCKLEIVVAVTLINLTYIITTCKQYNYIKCIYIFSYIFRLGQKHIQYICNYRQAYTLWNIYCGFYSSSVFLHLRNTHHFDYTRKPQHR